MPNGANFVDLHVYVGGAGALDQPGTLYDYVYADQTPDFPLPFTYPPFAAVVFYPLHLLPFGVVALRVAARDRRRALRRGADQPAAAGRPAIGGSRCCGPRSASGSNRCAAPSTTARSTSLLVLAVLYAVYSTRWWLSGLLVGLAAGVKLTPAVSGLYFVGARRWACGGVLGGRVRCDGGCLGAGGRRPGPLLLHRTARRRGPGRPDRDVVQPVVARRHLAHPRPRRRLRARRAGRHRCDGGAGGAGVAGDRRRRGPARRDRRRAVVRPAAVADLVDPPLGVADPADDLAAARAAARPAAARGCSAGAGWR